MQAKTPFQFINDQENIYFRCVEDCNEPIMITNRKGRLEYVNPAWSRTYGYPSEEAVGQTPRLLRSAHQSPDFYSQMWAQILNPEIGHWSGQLVNRAKDGREVPVLLNITPYKDSSGDTLGYMGVALDLSERHRLETHVARQDRLVTIGELTSGLAHEIGTPIGVIRGRAELLLMDKSLSEKTAQAIDIIIRQADRISALISTLLRFSRSGIEPVELRPINLSKCIDEVITLLSEKLRRHSINLELNVNHNLKVLDSGNKLEQILINLMLNSIYAIASEQKQQATSGGIISVCGQIKGDDVMLEFTDNGPGIPGPVREKMFMPFFTTKPAGEGTGLGLSIVLRLAHDLGGTFEFDGNYFNGARFRLGLKHHIEAGASECGDSDRVSPTKGSDVSTPS
jgi:PAS domain S-box-containing protein